MEPITIKEFVQIVQAYLPNVSNEEAEGLLYMFESLGYKITIE